MKVCFFQAVINLCSDCSEGSDSETPEYFQVVEDEEEIAEPPNAIRNFLEKVKQRERGCTSPCSCEKTTGTSKCLCEKKGGCGPSCSCDALKCRKKRQ